MNCHNHPETEATQECRLCGHPLCPACVVEVKGVPFCQDCLESRVHSAVPPVVPVTPPEYYSPRAAGWFSVLPGLGLLYLGEYLKALVVVLLVMGGIHISERTDAGGILIPVVWIGQIIYAVQEAKRLNRIKAGQPSPDPPAASAATSADAADSPVWGGILIALGALFLLDQFDFLHFDEIFAKLWPLLIIGLGLHILLRGRRKDSLLPRP